MAYEFDLEADFSLEPFVDALSTQIIEFALGYDLDADEAILMSVMLVPGGSYLKPPVDGMFDLRFGIRVKDLTRDWKVSAPDYSKEAVEKYIPAGFRPLVLAHILRCTSALVKKAAPVGVTMETYYSNLDPKALKKYTNICTIIKTLGYEMKEEFRDGTSGKDYWFLRRTN